MRREPIARVLKPDALEFDVGREHVRPAKVIAINGASVTLRVRVCSGLIVNRTVARSLLPSVIIIGHPLNVLFQAETDNGPHPATTPIVRACGSHWYAGSAPLNEADAALDDCRWPAISWNIRGESPFIDVRPSDPAPQGAMSFDF